ncbi:MAG: hypothetical protein WCG04_05430 [Alphaproteobacteria bacterium]
MSNYLVSCDLSKVSFANSDYIDAPLGVGPGSALFSQVIQIVALANFQELFLPPMDDSQKPHFQSYWEARFGYKKKGLRVLEHLF